MLLSGTRFRGASVNITNLKGADANKALQNIAAGLQAKGADAQFQNGVFLTHQESADYKQNIGLFHQYDNEGFGYEYLLKALAITDAARKNRLDVQVNDVEQPFSDSQYDDLIQRISTTA